MTAVGGSISDPLRAPADGVHAPEHVSDTMEARLRLLEDELRHARRSADAKGRYLATMSHEIRTPLTGVMSTVELLQATALDSEQAALVRTLKRSSELLLAVLDDVLDLSKVEAGAVALEARPFALRQVLDDVVALFEARAHGKGLDLACEIGDGVPPWLEGDSRRLQQVLANLVGNAVKFTDAGAVEIAVRRASDGLRFEVSDTGVGIGEALVGRLFEPFTQGEVHADPADAGTGLGLSICKGLIEAMGGAIRVQSEPGVGTRFAFSLPWAAARPPPSAARSTSAGQGPPRRILLAEDVAINRDLIARMLRQRGHEVHEVADGEQAVAAACAERFDLVLMDVQMPRVDGIEATARIREAGLQLPVVALTADARLDRREAFLASGFDHVVTKPLDWAALFAWIDDRSAPPAPDGAEVPGAAPGDGWVDVAVLADLATSLSPARLQRVLDAFEPAVRDAAVGVASSGADRDLDGLRRAAHALKGVAASFGANRLAELAAAIEYDRDPMRRWAAGHEELLDAVERSLDRVRQWREEA